MTKIVCLVMLGFDGRCKIVEEDLFTVDEKYK